MAGLECYITTFNCGRSLIDVDYFAASLFHGLQTDLPPDLIVLSLQEIAPLGYSFLGGSLLAPYFARLAHAVSHAVGKRFGADSKYVALRVENVGLTALMVFARHDVHGRVRWIETAGVGVGMWEMGNKGAVGMRIGVGADEDGEEEAVVTFVAAHLAPMEGAWERRNADWRSICENPVFERAQGKERSRGPRQGEESEPLLSNTNDAPNGVSTLFEPPTHLFFAGDLNYRTSDTPPSPTESKNWPQPLESSDDPRHFSHLLPKDQLHREQRQGKTLHHLAEAPIAFPPTYKYASAAQKHVGSRVVETQRTLRDGRVNDTTNVKTDDEEEVWLWAHHRMPSWCDRILFLETARPEVRSYKALPVQPTSDHRPVALSCTLPAGPVTGSVKAPFGVRRDWRQRRAAARRYEVVVGLLAYLGLTWEGEALLAGTVIGIIGGYLVLRALLGA